MRPALWSVAIQAVGSAATVAAALLVTSTMGLAAQGQFGLLRSWNDALVTIAVLGLPQGLLHLQYRESVPVAALRPWVLRHLLRLALLALLCAALALALLRLLPAGAVALSPGTVAVIAAAVPLAAAHLLWRSLALRDAGTVVYAVITAAPALRVVVALVPVCLLGSTSGLAWALLVAAALSAALSGWVVRRANHRQASREEAPPWSRATLWSVGVETGVQGVLTALSPALVLSTVGWVGASLAEVGVISLGLHVYQIFGVAAAYVAPMVYNRAASALRPPTAADIGAALRARSTPLRLMLGAAAAVIAMLVVRWLWPAGADALAMLSLMALAGLISMAVRLLVTLMLARGVFRPLTWQALARLLIVTGGAALLMRYVPATLAVPVSLAATEALMLVGLLRMLRAGDPREAAASGPATP